MEQILAGLGDALTLVNLLYLAIGVAMGVAVGAIPGLNGPMAVALAAPMTFFMSSLPAISFLLGILKGSRYGGSITAVLLNTPGDPAAAATCFDGYPMHRQGKSGKALKMSLYASVFGDIFAALVLILVAGPIARFALKMGPTEITAVIIFALTLIAILSGKSLLKGLISGVFGIFLSFVGTEPITATSRLTMGFYELQSGISFMAVAIGMLAISEIIVQVEEKVTGKHETLALRRDTLKENRIVSFHEFKDNLKTLFRSSLIGTGIGALPGCGATLASFLAYGVAKRTSKSPEKFGQGALEGVAAAESANSATVGSDLIPLFTLGIPGTMAAALLIGALVIHGVEVGPLMFREHGRFIYGIYGSLVVGSIFLLVIGGIGLRVFAKLIQAPKAIIYPIIILMCITGGYIEDNTLFAVAIMLIFGIVGYFMKKLDFSFVTFLVGFVLGPMFEFSLLQTLNMSMNNPMVIFNRPIALVILAFTLIFLCWGLFSGRAKKG